MTRSLSARVAATERTLEQYRGRPFDWAKGATCAHLARTQARNMGHRRLPALGRLRSAVSARSVLRRAGFATTTALLDNMFPRIAPAQMLVGDLAMLTSEDAFGAIVLSDGYGTLLGWHEAAPTLAPVIGAIDDVIGAWRL